MPSYSSFILLSSYLMIWQNFPIKVTMTIVCIHCYTRAGGIGLAAPVLTGPVFSQGKSKIPFLQKASNKQSASVILGLIRLIILSYNR